MSAASSGLLARLSHDPITVDAGASVAEAARAMARSHVGSVVVTEEGEPVGIVTDRDLTMAALTREVGAPPPACGLVASRPLLVVRAGDSLQRATELMREHGVRRVGVVDEGGALVGVVASDDLLSYVGGALGDLARAVGREFQEEADPTGGGPVFGRE